MSQSNLTRPSTSEIREGRLLKKIEKLTQQRDHYKELHDHYAKVIAMQPYLETRYDNYAERKAAQERVKAMEARVKEQETLIRILLKDDPLRNYEIDRLYSTLIKEEYRKMNDAKKS